MKTIVFDLDETLIHCSDSEDETNIDITIPIVSPDGEMIYVFIIY